MGSLVCLPAQLACCCSSAACTLCSCCPSCGNSVTTRIMYGLLLLLGAVVSIIMLAPGLQDALQKVPFCSNSTKNAFVPDSTTIDCSKIAGYLSVYRVCFSLTLFFMLMGIIMIGVKSSRDGRAGIQNGFWGIKYLIVIGTCIGAFFIPEGNFGPTWMVFGMIGGFLFIIIQVTLIIDFAYKWAEKWIGYYEETESRGWFAALLISSLAMFVASITGIALLYVKYTLPSDCGLNKFFISINLILCFISTVVSLLPKVQEYRPTSGLLQSSLITLYVTYLTWSAVSSSPYEQCNPGFLELFGKNSQTLHHDGVVGVILWIIVVIYCSIRTGSNAVAMSSTDSETPLNEAANEESADESDAVTYSWSFFHLTFAASTLYVMMTLTNWYSPNSSIDTFSSNNATMWVKITSSWICIALYNWVNVAPMILRNREF